MLLDGLNGELKNAAEACPLTKLTSKQGKEELMHEALTNPLFLIQSGGGPTLTNSQGVPFSGAYIDANGDLTVDLRSDMAAEARAKITYEYLLKFTGDPLVRDSLRFLMTREVAHFQMFAAALETIQPNFPMGILQGDPRYTHTYFNLSNGADARGPWNEGQGPWGDGESWDYVNEPQKHVIDTQGEINHQPSGTTTTDAEVAAMNKKLSKQRSAEVESKTTAAPAQWSSYPQDSLESPAKAVTART
jgi:Mn-containing catalase